MIASMIRELDLTGDFLQNGKTEPESIETIYFGGGTPSLLQPSEIAALVEAVRDRYPVTATAEVTLEANPDDMDDRMPPQWRKAGINRLSIGIQSFHQRDLAAMNRAHDAARALRCIDDVKTGGFDNFSVDLIYGIPGLSDADWKSNVDRVIRREVPHVSCYALTVEPKTALHHMIALHKTADIDPGAQARQFSLLMQWMQAAGYEHYEISNFCKPGRRSRHNASYWQGKKYLGIGPSAHSFNGRVRRWNVASNAAYLSALKMDKVPFEEEILSPANRLNESIMIGLRTAEGIDLRRLEEEFPGEQHRIRQLVQEQGFGQDRVVWDNDHLRLTNHGKLFADGIAASLFR